MKLKKIFTYGKLPRKFSDLEREAIRLRRILEDKLGDEFDTEKKSVEREQKFLERKNVTRQKIG